MKILITGGAGFLGLHLASFFSKKNHRLTLLDIQKFDESEYAKSYRIEVCDVRNKSKLTSLIKDQDIVIHAAAALPLWKKEDIYTTNIDGTRNILELAKKHKVKRVIYVSSTAVYGIPKKHPIVENDPRVGVGAYGKTKILAEDLCFQAIKEGLNVTIIRPKTFVGTGRLGVFEILFDWIHDGKKIPVLGNGNNRYQLLDVDDIVRAIYTFCLKSKKSYNGVFNIGAENFDTVKNDLQEVFDVANSGSKIFPMSAFFLKKALWFFEKIGVSPLYQWVYDTADKDSFVSIEKIKKTLKWKPEYSNSQALVKSYRWYLKNYKKIKSKTSGVTHTVGWKQGVLKLFKYFA
ncbi:MAG: NAD(P)-dependent oxidoreductase [Candidatus Levybacteria bacterium]|nr:NAD(P)-dependent oxidoreductase [Candidatus Levybacteria bacterium]